MDNFYKIQSGIPVPPKRRRFRHGEVKALSVDMKIGDSMLFPNRTKAKSLYNALKNLGFGVTIRNSEEGVRIWKVEE